MARNVAIVLAIAAAVYFIPGGGRAASTFEAALWVAFGLGIGYFALRMYREHHIALYGLGDRHRGLLYGAVALGVFVWVVRERMWYALQVRGDEIVQVHRWDGVGEFVWFVLVGRGPVRAAERVSLLAQLLRAAPRGAAQRRLSSKRWLRPRATSGRRASGRGREPLAEPAPRAARSAGRVPVQGRARPRDLRGQGEVGAQARRLALLQSAGAEQSRSRGDGRGGGAHRVRGRGDRGGGAAGGAELHQAVPPALQHPPARRQVLPVHRDLARRGLPARVLHARAPPHGARLLRPLLERQTRARDARGAGEGVHVPLVHGAGAGPAQRQPVPGLLHQAL